MSENTTDRAEQSLLHYHSHNSIKQLLLLSPPTSELDRTETHKQLASDTTAEHNTAEDKQRSDSTRRACCESNSAVPNALHHARKQASNWIWLIHMHSYCVHNRKHTRC